MKKTVNLFRSPPAAGLAALAWTALISLFFIPKWHVLWLFTRRLPYIPADAAASIAGLFSGGLPELLLIALVAVAAVGAGDLVLGLFRLEILDGPRLALSAALGLGTLAYMTFFLGLAGLYNTAGTWTAAAAMVILAVPGIRAILRAAGSGDDFKPGVTGFLLPAAFALMAVFLFSRALKPAVFYDAVTYHLGVPNYYILEGGIRYIPYDSCSNFPFAAEMLYTLGLLIHGLKLAQFTSVLVFLLFVLAVRSFCRLALPGSTGNLAALFMLLTPAFMESSVLYSNDLHVAYFAIVAACVFFLWERSRKTGWLVLMGVFTGFCLATKYVALVIVFPPAAAAVAGTVFRRKREHGRGPAAEIAVFALSAFAVFLPWLLKNYVYTGNPFYPSLYPLLGGDDMSPAVYENILSLANHPGFKEALAGLFRHPWELFMLGPEMMTKSFGVAAYMGPLIIILVPVTLLYRGLSPVAWKLCAAACLMLVVWNFSFSQTRYVYPAMALLLIVSAYGLNRIIEAQSTVLKVLLAGAAGFYLLFNLCLGTQMVNTWTGTAGFEHAGEGDDEYIMRRLMEGRGVILDSYPAYRYIDSNTDHKARVLIIGDAQHLYLKRRHLYSYLSGTTAFEVFADMKGRHAKTAAALKKDGITHMVFNPGELVRLQRNGALGYDEADNVYIEEFLGSGHARLLETFGQPDWPVYVYTLE